MGAGLRHSVLVFLMLLTQKVQIVLFLFSWPVKPREVMTLHGAPRFDSSEQREKYYFCLVSSTQVRPAFNWTARWWM